MFREQRVAVKQMHELIIDEDTLALLHREIKQWLSYVILISSSLLVLY